MGTDGYIIAYIIIIIEPLPHIMFCLKYEIYTYTPIYNTIYMFYYMNI